MSTLKKKLDTVMPELSAYVTKLMESERLTFGETSPPNEPGAYIVYDHNGILSYIGEAKGSGGLKDRLLSKHLSGDDKHAIQRAYKESYPNRTHRREYIKKNVTVQWVATSSANYAMAVERLMVLMFDPPWNRK